MGKVVEMVKVVFQKQQVIIFLYPCALNVFAQTNTAVVIAAETWRLGPLEKGFPSKR